MEVKIFVEGIADKKFLEDYIQYKYNKELDKEDIIYTEGWPNLFSIKNSEHIINKMRANSDNDGVNLLVFDADIDYNDKFNKINEWKNQNDLDFHIFLWPNNRDSGDLEVVLENIINFNNKPIFDCWDNFEKCLKSKVIEGREKPLTIPAKKTKIYSYLETLLGDSKSQKEKIKENKRDYRNKEHWNLDSEYLSPLESFLDPFFS